ncbi:MAG: 1-acyl-sn-glycerol-3-phosphate acyltransferase [Bacteroidia bacterium]
MLKTEDHALLNKHPREMSEEELQRAAMINLERIEGYFDERYSRALAAEVLPWLKLYFRPRFIGFDEMPARSNPERPLIYASNHSGMAFPWDAMVMTASLMEMHDFDLKKLFRPMAAPMLSASRLMNPYLGEDIWRRSGAIDATSLNFESLMQQQHYNVLIYPEGVPGIGKGFNKRYQLQTFSTSMVRMALKYDTDIVSLMCINGEWINPHAYSIGWINRLAVKVGIPFLFIGPLTLPMLLFPLVFYSALPANLTYVLGKRYSPKSLAGDKDWQSISQEEVIRVRDHIQSEMQQEMDLAVERFGQEPYRWRDLLSSLGKNLRHLPYPTPIGWPAVFTEFNRQYHPEKPEPSNVTHGWFRFWRIVWKNPIILAFFIPVLGWIPVLWKGLRGREVVKPWKPKT